MVLSNKEVLPFSSLEMEMWPGIFWTGVAKEDEEDIGEEGREVEECESKTVVMRKKRVLWDFPSAILINLDFLFYR